MSGRTTRSISSARCFHLEAGTLLLGVRGNRDGVVATASLFGDAIAEVRDLAIPCEALTLDYVESERATPPVARASTWGPRADTVTFRAQPGEGAAVSVGFRDGHRGVFDEIERRGRFHHLAVRSPDGWVVGWVDQRELVRSVPPRSRGSVLVGPADVPAPPGGYSGPAKVAAGTPVYAADGGVAQWAVVPHDAVLGVVAKKDAMWIELSGSQRVGRVNSQLSYDLHGHAWIPASAVEIQDPGANRVRD